MRLSSLSTSRHISCACHHRPHRAALQVLRYSTYQPSKSSLNDTSSQNSYSPDLIDSHPAVRHQRQEAVAHKLNYEIDRSAHSGALREHLFESIAGHVHSGRLNFPVMKRLYGATNGALLRTVPSTPNGGENNETSSDRPYIPTFNPGLLHVLYQPYLQPEKLLPDGTDQRFLPGPHTTWAYRLWARGEFTFHGNAGVEILSRSWFLHAEYVTNIVVPRSGDKVFVTVRSTLLADVTGGSRVLLHKNGATAALKHEFQPDRRVVTNDYTLCFLRDKPNFIDSPKPRMPPLSQTPRFVRPLRVSRHDLFAWSALSQNAHLIHLDPTFAREEYGLANLVVHGPLQLYLASQVLQHSLNTSVLPSLKLRPVIYHIKYECRAPFYVDEPAQVCAEPVSGSGSDSEKWQLWIQTGPAGSENVVFKATVMVKWVASSEISVTTGEVGHKSDQG